MRYWLPSIVCSSQPSRSKHRWWKGQSSTRLSRSVVPPSAVAVEDGKTITFTVTNVRDLGKIKIEKVVQGDVAGASTDFTAHVNCPGDSYDQDVALTAGNSWTNVTGNIPTGLECTVTEPTVPDGWTLKGLSPADGKVTVEIYK